MEFESGLCFTEKSGNYQGILVEYQENQGKLTFFSGKFSVGSIFSYAYFYVLKHFLTLSCYKYYDAALVFVFKNMSIQV